MSVMAETRPEKGSVLIAVLWLLAMLSIFAIAVSRQASQELTFGQWVRDHVQGRELAKAAVERALYEIRADKFPVFDAFQESWASNRDAFKEVQMPEGKFSAICEQDGEKRYGACDEAARINLNKAPEDVLKRLFMAADRDLSEEKATAVAQAVLDWRDPDKDAHPQGAESRDYENLPVPHQAANADFQTVEELSMIMGMTPQLFRKVRPFVTVYTDGKVNFNTASKTVLMALGLSDKLADRLLDFRKGADKELGTDDDEVFQDPSQITSAISAREPLSPEEFTQLSAPIAQGMVSVKSDVFRVHGVGHVNRSSRDADTFLTCVLKRNGTILLWQEGQET